MIKRLTSYIQNSSFQKKIIIMAMISGLVPLLILTFFSFSLIQHFVTEREKNSNLDILNGGIQQVDSKLTSYEEALSFLTNNNSLINGLSLKNPTNFEQYHFYINDIVPLFKNIMYQQSDITEVTLYTSLDFYNHGNYVKKIIPGELTDDLPFNHTTEAALYLDKHNDLYLYSQLFSKNSKNINLILFKIDQSKLFANLSHLSNDPYALSVKTAQGQGIYQFSNEQSPKKLGAIRQGLQFLTKKKLSNSATVTAADWQMTFSRPYSLIYQGLFLLLLSTLLIFVIAYLMLSLFIVTLSKNIVAPLQSLAQEMEAVPQGNFELINHYESNDEIGQLYTSYQYMLDQIKLLINEVYEAEIAQKKHELRALQSQINPHFFYNSLSLINNKAIMTGNDEISEMALLLSQYYRLSLNSGKHTISINQELEMTLTYVRIQQKMHHYSFDVETTIAEDLGDMEIINLLIQPFIENAIFHGLDHIPDGRKGRLVIAVRAFDTTIQFEVTDNGAGMTPEQLSSIFDYQSEHYGLQNVQQRIQLYYDKVDAITCTSRLNEGTTFKITLPRQIS
ncbi:sensor histidine kinase [Vagococcus salmoninarum]|uniref:sensor histidine kinase n=1 Tax=Vagococcus salmoninarum TaxID=2739 RepID=UPI0028D8D3D6|nr:histidine kinase [Vagococcus salmoninarum]